MRKLYLSDLLDELLTKLLAERKENADMRPISLHWSGDKLVISGLSEEEVTYTKDYISVEEIADVCIVASEVGFSVAV